LYLAWWVVVRDTEKFVSKILAKMVAELVNNTGNVSCDRHRETNMRWSTNAVSESVCGIGNGYSVST